MGTLGTPSPVAEERDNSRLIIVAAVAVVIAIAFAAAFLLREPAKKVTLPSPYIAQLKLSDFKMSAAENFIGATVSYIDGTITNTGNKTVTRVMVQVNFLDSMGQMAQREELPLRLFRNNGAYNEPVDLNVAPLGSGQTEPFRLTFDSISHSGTTIPRHQNHRRNSEIALWRLRTLCHPERIEGPCVRSLQRESWKRGFKHRVKMSE